MTPLRFFFLPVALPDFATAGHVSVEVTFEPVDGTVAGVTDPGEVRSSPMERRSRPR